MKDKIYNFEKKNDKDEENNSNVISQKEFQEKCLKIIKEKDYREMLDFYYKICLKTGYINEV